MFHVKRMSTEDFEFAVRITDTVNWGFIDEEFEFMTKLEPEGCFTLLYNSEKAGIATTISFGNMGWFGNLIVTENYRKKGAGTLLLKHAINYLRSKNVKTVGLYAYIDKIPFYEKLGFKRDSEFIVLKGKSFPSQSQINAKEAKKVDIQKIIDFDSRCFGASRRKLLEPIILNSNNLCYTMLDAEQIVGYAVAKVYDGIAEVGPLVCSQGQSDVAKNLLGTIFNRLKNFEISLCVSKKESAIIDILTNSGFEESFRVERMFLGPSIVKDCIYMAESLERG